MRSRKGRGRQGPGLLGAMGRPAVLPGPPAPVTGPASAAPPAVAGDPATADTPLRDEGSPGQPRIDSRQGRWLPRHQPWNAASTPGSVGRSIDELSAQLDELDELKQAGLLTEEEFARQRAWLLGT